MKYDLRELQSCKAPLSPAPAQAANHHDFSPLRYLGSLPLGKADPLGTGLPGRQAHASLVCGESAPRRAHDLVALDLFEYPA